MNFFTKPFKSFFLLGCFFCFFFIKLWVFIFYKQIIFNFYFQAKIFHVHEVFFGFILCIMFGFVFTASSNWTGKKSLSFFKIIFLLLLLIFLRFFLFFKKPSFFISFLDLSIIPFSCFFLFYFLIKDSQRNNQILFILFFLFFLSNLFLHFILFGFIDENFLFKVFYLLINIVSLFFIFISGKIIPFFVSRKLKTFVCSKSFFIEFFLYFFSFVIVFFDLFKIMNELKMLIICFLFFFNFIRFYKWFFFKIIKYPILFILFLSYFIFILNYFFRFLSLLFEFSYDYIVHFVSIGSFSIMIIGMITRVSLGHSNNVIKASYSTIFIYFFLFLSFFFRVFFINFDSFFYYVSSFFWSLGILCFIIEYFFIIYCGNFLKII